MSKSFFERLPSVMVHAPLSSNFESASNVGEAGNGARSVSFPSLSLCTAATPSSVRTVTVLSMRPSPCAR